jgi:hypothetical protein
MMNPVDFPAADGAAQDMSVPSEVNMVLALPFVNSADAALALP